MHRLIRIAARIIAIIVATIGVPGGPGALAPSAFAQAFPVKPVRIVSTLTAGSPADGLIRLAAQRLSEQFGQPVVVDVQAGAGGILGAQAVARSAADGHTMLYTLSTTVVITPQLLKTRPYELKDLTPLMVTSRAAISMVANIAFPPSNIRELVEYARANPGKLAYGSNGIGGIYHLEMEMLKQAHQLDIAHIPYKGGTDSLLAAVAGTIPIAFAPAASAMSQVRAGKVKILAILDYQRVADFPDVPSMGEQFAGYEKMSSGVDMYGPAGLPSALVKRLYGELAKAFNQPDVRQRMKEISFPYDGTGPDEMLATRIKELSSSARAIKAAGLKPE